MLGLSLYFRLIFVVGAAALTFLHQLATLNAWPFRSSIGALVMQAPTSLIIVLGIVALLLASARASSEQEGTRRYLSIAVPVIVLGVFVMGIVRLSEGEAASLRLWHEPGTLRYLFGALSLFICAGALAVKWVRRGALPVEPRVAWGAIEWILGVLLAVNIFLLALPEVRFVTGAGGALVVPAEAFRLTFGLQYSDVLALSLNPLFDTARWCLSWFTPQYFLTQMACVYLMAISIAFFCVAVSRFVGYLPTFALVSGIAWSKSVLLVVCTGTNIVTLFVAVAFAFWVLLRALETISGARSVTFILTTGALLGVSVALSLYTYAPSRAPCFLFAGVTALLLVSGAFRSSRFDLPCSSRGRISFVVALVLAMIAPAGVVLGPYSGNVSAFQRDFRGSILPDISKVRNGRPDFVDPTIEASTPDLPMTYGALVTDVPQSDGSTVREWVYWRRSPSELGWVFSEHLGRVFRKYQPFPAGEAWWFFGLLGTAIFTAVMARGRASLVYALAVGATSIAMISPFLIVPSPAEWRRGAAVMLVFGALAGLGLHWAIRLCASRARGSVLAVVVGMLAFVVFGKSSLREISSTPFAEVAIAMPCRASFLKPLLTTMLSDARVQGNVYMFGSPEDRCAYSAVGQLNRVLGLERVKLFRPSALSLSGLRDTLATGESVVIECGDSAGGVVRALCEELRVDSNARALYTARQDGDDLWIYTK